MAAIVNARDVLLQAAPVRIVPVSIPMDQVEGLQDALAEVAKELQITASAPYFTNATTATTPTSITLTAQLKGGLAGIVTWTILAGAATLTPSGNTCAVSGTTISGYSVTVRATLVESGKTYTADYTLMRYGALSAADKVSLTTQVVGQLASGNVTGLGALALLNVVDLNTQTIGALNGQTRITNLGNLAYANAVAANQIGTGTLAAGVIYAGNISADQINAGTLVGRSIKTALTGGRLEIEPGNPPELKVYEQDATSASDYAVRIAVGTGPQVIWARATKGNYAIRASQISTLFPLAALLAESSTAAECIYAYGTGAGQGLRVISAGTGAGITIDARSAPDIVFTPRSSVPSTKAKGSVFFHSTKGLCQSDGTSWYAIQDGTVVT